MRDIYLIAKFSNMDIIILFLFINLFTSPFPSRASFHFSFAHPKIHFVFQNIPFLLQLIVPFIALRKRIIVYITRAYTHIHTHTFSLFNWFIN